MIRRQRTKEYMETKIDYSKRIIFEPGIFKQKGHLLQEVTIPANTRQRPHFHKKQTELFYVLEGEGSIFFNDEEVKVRPSDTFICEPGDRHYVWNRGDKPMKILVFKLDFDKTKDDTVWLR